MAQHKHPIHVCMFACMHRQPHHSFPYTCLMWMGEDGGVGLGGWMVRHRFLLDSGINFGRPAGACLLVFQRFKMVRVKSDATHMHACCISTHTHPPTTHPPMHRRPHHQSWPVLFRWQGGIGSVVASGEGPPSSPLVHVPLKTHDTPWRCASENSRAVAYSRLAPLPPGLR